MSRKITIVMYHYVRDLRRSRYPQIKALDVAEFVGQLEHIRRYYNVVSMEELLEAASPGGETLPPNPLLLTFDDGYLDHFTSVLPILDRYGMRGAFFPPARAVLERKVLDVNKIHFLLAAVDDKSRILRSLYSEIERNRPVYQLEEPDVYYRTLAVANHYDPAEVMFIKRVLQKGLPEEVRSAIVEKLFAEFVTRDEAAFANELYMSLEQVRFLRGSGMFVGSHGYDHQWLNTLSRERQESEIDRSLNFLETVGCRLDNWVMCHPYGGYDASLLDVLQERGCRLGLGTEVAVADLDAANLLALPRIDTNDLPKYADAPRPACGIFISG